ncbi:MAG: type II toxin-antitoxin system VapC family toxin [Myxococcaceae bacterium]
MALDTVVFIYFIEEHPDFMKPLLPLFEAIDTQAVQAVTSGITLLEVLTLPYRAQDVALAERYESLLTQSRGLHLVDIDRPLLHAAAQLRARFSKIRTPDALQLAAALRTSCTAFITNDRSLPTLPGLKIVQLGEYR